MILIGKWSQLLDRLSKSFDWHFETCLRKNTRLERQKIPITIRLFLDILFALSKHHLHKRYNIQLQNRYILGKTSSNLKCWRSQSNYFLETNQSVIFPSKIKLVIVWMVLYDNAHVLRRLQVIDVVHITQLWIHNFGQVKSIKWESHETDSLISVSEIKILFSLRVWGKFLHGLLKQSKVNCFASGSEIGLKLHIDIDVARTGSGCVAMQ